MNDLVRVLVNGLAASMLKMVGTRAMLVGKNDAGLVVDGHGKVNLLLATEATKNAGVLASIFVAGARQVLLDNTGRTSLADGVIQATSNTVFEPTGQTILDAFQDAYDESLDAYEKSLGALATAKPPSSPDEVRAFVETSAA